MTRPPSGDDRLVPPRLRPRPRLIRGAGPRRLGPGIPWPLLSASGLLVLIVVGSVLLALPLTSADGEHTAGIDAVFTAVSAVTVTGLTVVDTAEHWNAGGKWLVLVLIQLGGLGIMTATSFAVVLLGFRIGIRGRALAREDLAAPTLGNVRRFVLSIVLFTLAVEGIGFGLLYAAFIQDVEPPTAVFQAAFHAVSAFNNAGFDIRQGGRSLAEFQGSYPVLLTMAALIIVGGLSFAVVSNVLTVRRVGRFNLNTKLVLAATAFLIIVGAAYVLATEYGTAETLGGLSWDKKVLNAFFTSVNARTAGFSTLPTHLLAPAVLFSLVVLMFIGAAAGSTGGGIKVNSFGVVVSAAVSSLKGHSSNQAFSRRIPEALLHRAVALILAAAVTVIIAAEVLAEVEGLPFIESIFVTVSAFATVGLSPLDPGGFTVSGKVLLMVLMVLGKAGVPLLMLQLSRGEHRRRYEVPEDRVVLA